MAIVPRLLRPSVLVRRKAMYAGFLGGSTLWKVVGVVVFGKSTLRKLVGKSPEAIDLATLKSGRTMQVTTAKPLTRRRRRKLAKAGIATPTLQEHRELAQLWAASRSKRAS